MLALPEIYVNGSANLVTTGLPMRIGVYALAKDEEKNVEQWLHHTADADFRIVVDTGSSDRTVDLLKAAGVDVIEETWTPFRFDEPRNLGLSRAVERGGHWFLCPDFDEWYSENWRHEIESIVSRRPTVTQIRVPICLHYDTHTEPGLSRDFKIHGLGGQWVQPIHEYLKFDKPLEVEADQIILNHRQDDRKPRKAFYFQLAKQHQELDPSNEWVSWFVFNEARIQSQDMGEIYEAARKYIELTRPYTEFRSIAFYWLAKALGSVEGPSDSVIDQLFRSITEHSRNRESWEMLAEVAKARGDVTMEAFARSRL